MSLTTVRAALDASDYASGVRRLALAIGHTRIDDRLYQAAGRLLLACDPPAQLLELFRLGLSVTRDSLVGSFPELDLAGAAAAGLIAMDGTAVAPLVRIDLLEGRYVACDPDVTGKDSITGVNPATRTTAAYLPRRPGRRALDLGTGAGMLALVAAGFSEQVVATDVLPRALRFVLLNAALNGIANVQTRLGSFYEPVTGERFDTIVANLPYVISPSLRFAYRDGGLAGDEVSRQALRTIPGLLEPGGLAAMHLNWIHDDATQSWFGAVNELLRGSGCDAIVVRIATETPLEYAYFWTGPLDLGTDEFEAEVAASRHHLTELSAAAVTTAVVILRRHADDRPATRVAVSMAGTPSPGIGARLRQLFDTHQLLAGLDDDALLNLPLKAAPQLLLTTQVGGAGRELSAPSAPGQRREITPALAEVARTVTDDARPVGEAGRAQVKELRAIVKLGFLEPAPG